MARGHNSGSPDEDDREQGREQKRVGRLNNKPEVHYTLYNTNLKLWFGKHTQNIPILM